ncbi:MAG: DNA-directed RNA polymerase subunit alpha, partial [Acidobacteria bacterium]|nr:DNA-directed RNA polymerase subunit alpha [Acidobacteriota bacterium]
MWKGFQKPKRLASELESLTDKFGKFSAQPFERGWGTTVGNALRRALLSSVEGAAITAVKIEGVLHEFSPIPGVVEDATDIILNLKQIPLKLNTDQPKTIYLKADKPGVVTSAMIEENADFAVLDKNVYISTLGEDGKLEIEMRVKNGRGYVPADRNFDEDLPIGYIPVDSVHSPVRKVNYSVKAARLGQMTDYEELMLEVWTNGAITPQDAIGLASKLMKDHMSIFINFEESPDLPEQLVEGMNDPRLDQLDRSVEELELSVTTLARAKAARPLVEQMITLGKQGSLHSRRQAAGFLMTPGATQKLFDTLATRFADRAGGYTRIVQAGFRVGDGAHRAVLELIGSELKIKEKKTA